MKQVILLTIVLGLLFVSNTVALEPGDTLWTRTYGGSESDGSMCVQQTTDSGYIVAGIARSFGAGGGDVWLLKTDANGDTLWTQTYGGAGFDHANYVQQTNDGGYIIAGNTRSFGAGASDVYLVKTDADGDTLWTRAYGGAGYDYGNSVHQTNDGGYIIASTTNSFGAGSYDVWLLKTDTNGDTLWTHTYGGSDWDFGNSSQQTADGGYIIAGYTQSFGADVRAVYLLKTDATGGTLWTRMYGGSNFNYDASNCVQQTNDGGYIIAGYTSSFGAGGYDFWLLKTDANGDTLWTRAYGGSGAEHGESVQQTADGGYIVTGDTDSFGAGSYDVWLLKTDTNGDTLWTQTYGGSGTDWGFSVQQTTDGRYILAGSTSYDIPYGPEDVWLLRIAGEELPAISIEIVPDDPPVTVPQGGSFGFTGTLTNNTEDPQVADAWTMAVGPEKETYGPFKELNDIELDPYETRAADFNQRVPNLAPLGFYSYIAYCGDYPSTVMDSSFFQVEVIAGTPGGRENLGWLLSGSFDRGHDLASVPSKFALLGNYPNPFNASTVIDYQLPLDSHVKLEVYNLLGQRVASLVDEKQQAGYRSVNWDASEVSSGLYFYKLTAGDFTETKRMMLVK